MPSAPPGEMAQFALAPIATPPASVAFYGVGGDETICVGSCLVWVVFCDFF
jgi:hypothetical protein